MREKSASKNLGEGINLIRIGLRARYGFFVCLKQGGME
jgi:hypothetical protein